MVSSLKVPALGVLLVCCAASSAMAAETANLALKGEIRPAACGVTLDNGGVIDFGTIRAASLNAKEMTRLPVQNTILHVQCDAPTHVSVDFMDNRAASSLPYVSTYAQNYYGIGMNGDAKIGSYAIAIAGSITDGQAAAPIASKDSGTSWLRMTGVYYTQSNALYSWAKDSANTPSLVQSVEQPIALYVSIAPRNSLGVIDEVVLDGSATISITYL